MNALLLQQVVRAHGADFRLGPIDLTIQAGEVVGLLGVNGAGKSTLLRVASGVMTPTSGEVLLGSRPLREWRAAELARHRAVVGLNEAAPGFDVKTTLALSRRVAWPAESDAASERRALSTLERLGRASFAGRQLSGLSSGERQWISLARAVCQIDGAVEPRLLLLDEPVAHLDAVSQPAFLSLVRELAASGTAVLLALHDWSLAARYCDRVVVLHRGAIAADGPPVDALGAPALSARLGVRVRLIPQAWADEPAIPVLVDLPDRRRREPALLNEPLLGAERNRAC